MLLKLRDLELLKNDNIKKFHNGSLTQQQALKIHELLKIEGEKLIDKMDYIEELTKMAYNEEFFILLYLKKFGDIIDALKYKKYLEKK